MRRRRTLPLTLGLVLIFALSMAPTLITAQAPEGSGIVYEPLSPTPEPPGDNIEIQQYAFTFAGTAYIPEKEYPEQTVVKIVTGTFAFRVGGNVVFVDPPPDPADPQTTDVKIQILNVAGEHDPGQPETAGPFLGEENGTFLCADICALPFNTLVLLNEGTTVFIPGNTTCFICNAAPDPAETGLLHVYASVQPGTVFSWVREADQASGGGGVRVFPNSGLPNLVFGCR